jgi:transposase
MSVHISLRKEPGASWETLRRGDAAKTLGVTLQIVRDWVLRFNAQGPEGLFDRKAKGARPKLNAEQKQVLAQKLEQGPIPAVDGVVRWRLFDLVGWIYDEWGISIAENSLSRIVRDLGYRKLSARPKHHGQNNQATTAKLGEARRRAMSRAGGSPKWRRYSRLNCVGLS